jgi:hypothetical protein
MTGCPSNNFSDPIERENSGQKPYGAPRSPPTAAASGKNEVVLGH